MQSANVDRARAVARQSDQPSAHQPPELGSVRTVRRLQAIRQRPRYGAHGLSEYLEVKAVMGFEFAEQAPRH
jgi:hypothetical protein